MNDHHSKEAMPRILVIDDEESIRMMLAQALEIGGFETISAGDGAEGMALVHKHGDIGVILTDFMMPKMNGMEVLEAVKEHDRDAEVIVLTGFGGNESAIEAMKKGAYDYLQKPTNVEELLITVRKAVERRRLSVENRLYQEELEALVEERTGELIETKNFLQSVLDSSLDYSIIATDPEGIITLFNTGSERLLGYAAEEVVGVETVMLFTPEDEKGQSLFEHEQKDEAEPSGQIVEREKVVQHKDGERIVVSLSSTALQDEHGEVVGTLGIAKDISEQKKLEDELKQYTENLEHLVEQRTGELKQRNDELEKTLAELGETQHQLLQSEKLASIGQLAAGVAHEINNPIGFVHSNLGTLGKYTRRLADSIHALGEQARNGGLQTEEYDEIVKQGKVEYILEDIGNIIKESQDGTLRVKTIVKDLKNVSSIDRAQISLTSLEEGLDSTLNIVWNELKYKAEVKKEYGGIPHVVCNPQQINQIFLNMLINASHAIEEATRGLITIRTRLVGKEQVAIEIEDNGSGIPEEHKKKLFEPFFTTKEIGKGTGLGLSISYRIVQEHGGEIEVESEVGKGTLFRILLPIEGPMMDKLEG